MAEEFKLPEPLGPVETDFVLPEPIGLAEEEESEQTVIGSIARGAGAGLVDIAQGISELGIAGLEASELAEEGNQEKLHSSSIKPKNLWAWFQKERRVKLPRLL
jgi:hypothetical protein